MKKEAKEPYILPRASHNISRSQIDPDALKVMYRLLRNGFKAYMVGGAVRDILLGRKPKDFDVATDARPGQVKKLFANCFLIGRRFRLAHIRFKGGKVIEVATFRREAEPDEDGQTDPHNTFGTPKEDAFRRDISINALFYDISTFSIIDYVGGLKDIEHKRVCIIGDPSERYVEDPVRMWRVLRYASRQGFTIEHGTARAIEKHKYLLGSCSGSRLYEELNKDLVSGFSAELFCRMAERSMLSIILGDVGRIIEESPEATEELARGLKLVDESVRRGDQVTQVVSYGLLLWPWACRIIREHGPNHRDKMKLLTDVLAGSGIQLTIPKALKADMIHVFEVLDRMICAIQTGSMRSSLLKKASYKSASVMFAMITRGRAVDGEDAFLELFREKYPLARSLGSQADKKKRHRRFRRRRQKASHQQPADSNVKL